MIVTKLFLVKISCLFGETTARFEALFPCFLFLLHIVILEDLDVSCVSATGLKTPKCKSSCFRTTRVGSPGIFYGLLGNVRNCNPIAHPPNPMWTPALPKVSNSNQNSVLKTVPGICTLQRTNISHLGKGKSSSKVALKGDMLVPGG